MIAEERAAAVKECLTTIRPYISGVTGRERLQVIELDLEDQVILVAEEREVREEPVVEQFVFIDESCGQFIEEPDYRRVVQTISRRK